MRVLTVPARPDPALEDAFAGRPVLPNDFEPPAWAMASGIHLTSFKGRGGWRRVTSGGIGK